MFNGFLCFNPSFTMVYLLDLSFSRVRQTRGAGGTTSRRPTWRTWRSGCCRLPEGGQGPGSHLDHLTICSETMHFVVDLMGDSKCLVVFFVSALLSPRFTSDLSFSGLRQQAGPVEPHPEVQEPRGDAGDHAAAACLKVDRVPALPGSPDHLF